MAGSTVKENVTLFDDWMHETYLAPSDDSIKVRSVECEQDFADFENWLKKEKRPIAYDIETSGLNMFHAGWVIKTLQWGDEDLAFVFIEGTPWFQKSLDLAMSLDLELLAHNASYDALGLHIAGYVDSDQLLKKTWDTYIFAHLFDPRPFSMGGTGLKLKELADHWLGAGSSDSDKAMKKLFGFHGWSVDEGFKKIPKTHPTLIQYGGTDVVLTARLFAKLQPAVQARGVYHLVKYEHLLMRLTAEMRLRGILVDVEYADFLGQELDLGVVEETEFLRTSFGIENPLSAAQVSKVLLDLGVVFKKRTKGGAIQLDQKTLDGLIISTDEKVRQIGQSVKNIREFTKFRSAYVDGVLGSLDEQSRVHPNISALRAVTARMAVDSPPLQQIPAKDDRIRRMFVADEGCLMGAVDFSGIELRVMAALSRDPVMLKVFAEGGDLHQATADIAGVDRRVGKTVNFAKTYGAGPRQIAESAGISHEAAVGIVDMFNSTYKGLHRYDMDLRAPIRKYESDHVTTYSGRKIPVDAEYSYMALNYVVQSTARDVLGKAMIKLKREGFFDYALLPVHDEVLFNFPEDDAKDLCISAARCMECEVEGVKMSVEANLGDRSWGSLKVDGEHETLYIH